MERKNPFLIFHNIKMEIKALIIIKISEIQIIIQFSRKFVLIHNKCALVH